MAHLINESRGRQGVEECEQIEQAIEIKAWYAKKKKDDTKEHVRTCKARKTIAILIAQAKEVTVFKKKLLVALKFF
jgi:hypothetical protein